MGVADAAAVLDMAIQEAEPMTLDSAIAAVLIASLLVAFFTLYARTCGAMVAVVRTGRCPVCRGELGACPCVERRERRRGRKAHGA